MESTHDNTPLKIQNNDKGYAVIGRDYLNINTSKIKQTIANSKHVSSYLNTPFHSIANLFYTIPELMGLILPKLNVILKEIGANYKCIGSTYYDKLPGTEWTLEFHQDVHIKLRDRLNIEGFNSWIKKTGYYQVCPSIDVLENIVLIRIHLDDSTIENGALSVVSNSHLRGFINAIDYRIEDIVDLEVSEGDLVKMSPLLLHSSGPNKTDSKRRVIHLEFSNLNLPWFESHSLDNR